MREDLLHFIWRYKRIQFEGLTTNQGQKLIVIDTGQHNYLSGPDFFNAKIEIEGQLWAGNVEIHINSSDWFVHGHETDTKYDNVILHVVWNDDIEITRKDNSVIPTLELKDYISSDILHSYKKLFDNSKRKFINCENEIGEIDPFVINNWTTRLYIERLESKSVLIQDLLHSSKNDWEKVLYILLLKNFGSKINSETFLSLAQHLDYSVILKLSNRLQLESLLMGMSGLLDNCSGNELYVMALKKEFDYLMIKFNLDRSGVLKPEFFKLRPPNFPTIRLSQFAELYTAHKNLFKKVIEAEQVSDYYELFNVKTSSYWENHFTFSKESKKSTKVVSKSFVDLLLINTIIPIRFCYSKFMGKDDMEILLKIVGQLKPEKNTLIGKYRLLGVEIDSAKQSQSILQLHNEYCAKNKCLQCSIGSSLLRGNI